MQKFSRRPIRNALWHLRFFKDYIIQLPIHKINESNHDEFALKQEIEANANRMLELTEKRKKIRISGEQADIDRMLQVVNQAIDRGVYQLYGLTEDDINIVETSLST